MDRVVITRPSHPETPNDENWGANHTADEALFRRREAFPLLNQFWIVPRRPGIDQRADRRANANADEDEAILCDGESPDDHEDNRNGLEHCGAGSAKKVREYKTAGDVHA